LRAQPDHRSELRSQLLMGEVVKVERHAHAGSWWRVRNLTDGYSGWSRAWGLVACSRPRAKRWLQRARGRVLAPRGEVRSVPGGGVLVSPVFWLGRMITGPSRRGYRSVELPDGRRGWIAARDVSVGGRSTPTLGRRIRDLMGIPYLWGGRTPMGIDCSALIQLLLAEQGIPLPRDAKDQWRATVPAPRGRPRFGDLFFFASPGERPSHVGLSLGDGYFLHARGRVLIGALDRSNPLCDMALADQFRGARSLPSALPAWASRQGRPS
jgi:cell wall-associated NlpC family hydrolase